MIRSTILSLFLATTTAIVAQAATIVQTENFDVLSVNGDPEPETLSTLSARLAFDRFDPSLGTLTGVRLAFLFDLTADLSFQCRPSGGGVCVNSRVSSEAT